jgi:hypothetical protein
MCTASADPQNEEIKTGCLSFIDCHENVINGLLYSIVKSEGSSVPHYGPEKKSHSLEYRHPTFPQTENVQDWPFHWKMHAHCFWGCGIFIHQNTRSTVRRATSRIFMFVPCISDD